MIVTSYDNEKGFMVSHPSQQETPPSSAIYSSEKDEDEEEGGEEEGGEEEGGEEELDLAAQLMSRIRFKSAPDSNVQFSTDVVDGVLEVTVGVYYV